MGIGGFVRQGRVGVVEVFSSKIVYVASDFKLHPNFCPPPKIISAKHGATSPRLTVGAATYVGDYNVSFTGPEKHTSRQYT